MFVDGSWNDKIIAWNYKTVYNVGCSLDDSFAFKPAPPQNTDAILSAGDYYTKFHVK